MKHYFASIAFVLIFCSFITVAFAQKTENYNIDVQKSKVTWFGKKLTGSHNGSLKLKSGFLSFKNKSLLGGTFVADMTSIKDDDNSERLEKHLKSDDFFGVEKFPEANFVIKKVEGKGASVLITGDFSIKGKISTITFPAKLTWNSDKTVAAIADKIVIDRTKHGIEYKSKTIFSTLGNNFIDDEFTITVKLIASK